MDTQIETLRSMIRDSDNIVFFGGAGVSTESGIPDFRSTSGLYNQRYEHPPETMLSHGFFMNNTSEFYRFYRDKMVHLDAKPNAAHFKLAELESDGKLKAVVTQNIDNLHQTAGSRCVYELHGSVYRNFCMRCGKPYPVESIMTDSRDVPRCSCTGIIKPDVVLYDEPLDQKVMEDAALAIKDADVLIVGGTSLNVYPAAGLLRHYRGGKLILINKSELPHEGDAALVIRGSIGEVLRQV
ncbi:MAG: NAD-dependent protein deacylase [Methanomassiliicoccaceae archaeon]|nr:NAD-dependent protein deacylase [Methanomassiliicoccaceae archaeon]